LNRICRIGLIMPYHSPELAPPTREVVELGTADDQDNDAVGTAVPAVWLHFARASGPDQSFTRVPPTAEHKSPTGTVLFNESKIALPVTQHTLEKYENAFGLPTAVLLGLVQTCST
jgi:hypothetical protein